MQKAILIKPSLKRQVPTEEERMRAKELYGKLKTILKKLEVRLEELEAEKKGEFVLDKADIIVIHSKNSDMIDKINFDRLPKLKGVIVVDPSKEHANKIADVKVPKMLIGSSNIALKDLEYEITMFVKKILSA